VERELAQRLANKLAEKSAQRRSGLIAATQERFAIEAHKPAVVHLADFVATLQARQNTSKHVSMARRHIEEIIATAKPSKSPT